MRIKKKRKTHSKRRKTYRKKRRNPMLLGNPRRRSRRSYRKRRNPGFGRIGGKIPNILINGGMGILGAAGVNLVTNGVAKLAGSLTGKAVSPSIKNWLTLVSAIAIAVGLPKFKIAGKYADAIASGAVIMAGMKIAKSIPGIGSLLEGEDENPELDRIISNLNVDGDDTMLLGFDESSVMAGDEMAGYVEDVNGYVEEY